ELIQMDASQFFWFGQEETHLHVAIDDASGDIVGAYFDTQETLKGYYHVLEQILATQGIPFQFLTDKRTVFTYVSKQSKKMEEDTFTQFGYACHQLGIAIKTSSIPQAKGRVERLNQTLQSRLPIDLQRHGITSIDQANRYLKGWIKRFNKQFGAKASLSVFEEAPKPAQRNLL
ncbi:transposase family protein, partial [Streptococcus sobrinus]